MAINVNYCECEPMNAVKKEQDCKRDYKALAEKFCDMLERDMRADYMTCKDVACLVTALIVWLSGGKADAFITYEHSDHPNICYSEYLMAKTLFRAENKYETALDKMIGNMYLDQLLSCPFEDKHDWDSETCPRCDFGHTDENGYCSVDDLNERIEQSRKCWKKWALEEE